MSKKVIIIGTGGHAKVVADIVLSTGDRIYGFLDDYVTTPTFLGFTVLGTVTDYVKFSDAEFIVAIGSAAIRERIVKSMPNAVWYRAIHPKATISPLHVSIGRGTVIMPGAIINPDVYIGEHCIINTNAVVEHDNYIEEYVHVSVCAALAGTVRVGAKSLIGMGAIIINNIEICANCTIGAGAIIIKKIETPGTYVGAPGRRVP